MILAKGNKWTLRKEANKYLLQLGSEFGTVEVKPATPKSEQLFRDIEKEYRLLKKLGPIIVNE